MVKYEDHAQAIQYAKDYLDEDILAHYSLADIGVTDSICAYDNGTGCSIFMAKPFGSKRNTYIFTYGGPDTRVLTYTRLRDYCDALGLSKSELESELASYRKAQNLLDVTHQTSEGEITIHYYLGEI